MTAEQTERLWQEYLQMLEDEEYASRDQMAQLIADSMHEFPEELDQGPLSQPE